MGWAYASFFERECRICLTGNIPARMTWHMKTEHAKKDLQKPKWLDNLRALMAHRGFNARSLSLTAGLNATAVRDMLEGRARFPRYDTVESLSKALSVTPAQLMGGTPDTILHTDPTLEVQDPLADDDLNLLTEIIARLQEVAEEHDHPLKPHDFAAMVTAIYRQVQEKPAGKITKSGLEPHINHLITYETLRSKRAAKKK